MDLLQSNIAGGPAVFAGSGANLDSFVETGSGLSVKFDEQLPIPEELARALGRPGGYIRGSGSINSEAMVPPAVMAKPTSADIRLKLNAFRKKLQDTLTERAELDKQMCELKTELRKCEISQERLINLEVLLSQETAELEEMLKPKPSGLIDLDTFLAAPSKQAALDTVAPQSRAARAASTSRAQPLRTPRAASPEASRPYLISPGQREPSLGPSAGSALRCPSMGRLGELEDSIGKDTATCCFCGLKFPLDAEAIDRHSKVCIGRRSPARRATARESSRGGTRTRSHTWTYTQDSPEFALRRPR